MWIIRTYIVTFRKFDDFGGRANRAEFRNFGIVPFVIQLCFPVIGALSPVGYLFENVFSLVPLVPAVSLVVRRLHDTGTNGWLVLPGLVPFLNFLILYLLFSITAIHTTTAMDFRRTDRPKNPFLPGNRYNGCPISRYRKNPGLSDPETVTPGNLLLNFPG